jgi:hypothetical protein
MTTVTKSFEVRVNKQERTITNSYTQGTYQVNVETYFTKYSKAYIAIVSEAKIEGAMVIIRYKLYGGGGDYREKILTQKTDRYNFKTLEQVHAQAVELASGTVGTLLQKGKTNTQIEEDA